MCRAIGLTLRRLARLCRAIALNRSGLYGAGFARRQHGACNPVVRDDGFCGDRYCGPAAVLIVELLPVLGGLSLDLQLR